MPRLGHYETDSNRLNRRTVHHVCSHFTDVAPPKGWEKLKLIINYRGKLQPLTYIYLSSALVLSLRNRQFQTTMRTSRGEFAFRLGRGLLRTYPLLRCLAVPVRRISDGKFALLLFLVIAIYQIYLISLMAKKLKPMHDGI